MAKQTINIGTSANDGTGSTLREAFDITNDNFTELYDGTGGLLYKLEGTNFTGSLLVGHNTTGTLDNAFYNTGIGIGALDALGNGDYNIAIGYNAGTVLATGGNNTLIGGLAGASLTGGDGNVAIGKNAMFSANGTESNNVAIGFSALSAMNNNASNYNTAVGYNAGVSVTTGTHNTLIGGLAGDALTIGDRNIAIGHNALGSEDTGNRNVAIGYNALSSQNYGTDNYNVVIGYAAGSDIADGIKNTIIGGLAGDNLTTGSNNILIGYDATASAVGVSNEVTIGDSNISTVRIPSDSTLKIGASGDLQLEHLSSNSFIKNTAVGDLYIENQVDDKDIIFRSDDGSGGLATYFACQGSGVETLFYKRARWADNVQAQFGASADMALYHDGSHSYLKQSGTGDLYIQQFRDDGDIVFQSDDGSGAMATYFFLDGSSSKTVFPDNKQIQIGGGGGDGYIYSDGTNMWIQGNNPSADMKLYQGGTDGSIRFYSDNGSGGVAEYFAVDGGEEQVRFFKETEHQDSVKAKFGDSGDLQIQHTGATGIIDNQTGDLIVKVSQDNGDIIFQSDNGSGGIDTYFRLDGGDERTEFEKEALFNDNVKLQVGSSADMEIYHDGSNSFIRNTNTNLIIKNDYNDGDIIFESDDGSGNIAQYYKIDGGSTLNIFYKDVFLGDGVKSLYGNSSDLQIYHNNSNDRGYIYNTTGDLYIENDATDGDIKFYSDDGSGGTAQYFRLDGGVVETRFLKSTLHFDNVSAKFGDSGDCQIVHDGSNTKIVNITGDLKIGVANTLAIQNNAYDENIASFTKNGGVSLYHDNSKKLETTSTGIEVTGTVDATQSSTTVPVLRLTDDGVANYDFVFPDANTIELQTNTSSDKTFKLENDGSGKFDFEVADSSSGLILKSPNGTRYRITVDNSGNLSTTAL